MIQTLIESNYVHINRIPAIDSKGYIAVSEFFYDSIQGEGNYTGYPAAFLRLKGCTLNCSWCDTKSVWRYGNMYGMDELMDMIKTPRENSESLITKFDRGQHLVITGGSPLKQQDDLLIFLKSLKDLLHYTPFIELENECVIKPKKELIDYISCWNNSPKLANSNMSVEKRYIPSAITSVSCLPNSWFKFVIEEVTDWNDIYCNYLARGLVIRDQIILMPQGETREAIARNRSMVAQLAVREGVRYSTREQIMLWNDKKGV